MLLECSGLTEPSIDCGETGEMLNRFRREFSLPMQD